MSLPGNEIRVTSWEQLMEVLHSRNLIPPRPAEGNHFRSYYVFRGMDVATWGLETSIQRIQRTANTRMSVIENSLIRSFRKYANAGAFDEKSEWYVLAVAQHNGLPTRCLDWTASPLVAAHFACGDAAHKDKDGVIWCLDAGMLREINENSNPKIAALTGIAWVYDTRLLEERFAGLAGLDDSHSDGDLMLLWEPPSLDSRIANQFGLLSLMNDRMASQESFMRTHIQQYPDMVVRIVIDASMKSEARDMLDQNNISERTLFPGLPGLCSWIKRYYSTAW